MPKKSINAYWRIFKYKDIIDNYKGSTAQEDGVAGLVPSCAAGETGKFLKSDGTWDKISELTKSNIENALGYEPANTTLKNSFNVRVISSAVTDIKTNDMLICTQSMTLNLPCTANLNIYIKRNFETGTLSITPASGTIDGESSVSLSNKDCIHIYCDGTNFYII